MASALITLGLGQSLPPSALITLGFGEFSQGIDSGGGASATIGGLASSRWLSAKSSAELASLSLVAVTGAETINGRVVLTVEAVDPDDQYVSAVALVGRRILAGGLGHVTFDVPGWVGT